MGTADGYRYKDARRACDICGHLWFWSDLTRIAPLRWACPDDVDGLTAEDISRHNANARPLIVKAIKHALDLVNLPTFQTAEAAIFNLIAATPADQVVSTSTTSLPRSGLAPGTCYPAEQGGVADANADNLIGNYTQGPCAGWSAIYLANMVLEAVRPARWLTRAQAKMTELADLILAYQFGSTTSSFTTYAAAVPTQSHYGAVYLDLGGSGPGRALDL